MPFAKLSFQAVCSAYVCSICAGSFPQTRNLPHSHSSPLPSPLVQEFEKDVAEQCEKLPSLQEDAEEFWEEFAPGQWLRDKMAALEDMFDQLDQLCASRKDYLGR